MFSWCFKCSSTEYDEVHERPKTRSDSSSRQTALAPDSFKESKKSLSVIQKECLDAHNKFRDKHGQKNLKLNKEMNAYASEWAKHLADTNSLQHRKKCKYGENLFLGTGLGPQVHEIAVQTWYDEINNYNFNRPGFNSNCGHFTQVIWKATKELGVGIATKDNRIWVVCNYNPPGNVMGNYLENVAPLLQVQVGKIVNKMKPKKPPLKKPGKSSRDLKIIEDPISPKRPSVQVERNSIKKGDWSEFELECLQSHNKYRAIHGSPAMKLNRKLCDLAQDWSKHLTTISTLEHRPKNEYGENIYYSMNMEPSAEQCVRSWYDEIKKYNFKRPGFSSGTGHFTQVVWKDSVELGVGVSKINNMFYVVCNYSPAGNVMNQYKEQVLPPGSKPSPESSKPRIFKTQKKPDHSFEEVCLETHNNFRSLHGSPPLTLNKNLNFFANDWAHHLAKSNAIEYRKNNRFGENIFIKTGQDIRGDEPVEYWYKGIDNYNFQFGGYSETTKCFTQVIWKNSKQLGVGVAKVGRSIFVVCNYDPKGNIPRQFDENVESLDGNPVSIEATFSVDDDEEEDVEVDIYSEFANRMLKYHNICRVRHQSPKLEISNKLMRYCKNYIDYLLDECEFILIPEYAVSVFHFEKELPTAEEIVFHWYQEIKKYDFDNAQDTSEARHFTQIVWKNTQFMGVAVCNRKEASLVVVCYEPAGNIQNQYKENVIPEK